MTYLERVEFKMDEFLQKQTQDDLDLSIPLPGPEHYVPEIPTLERIDRLLGHIRETRRQLGILMRRGQNV